MKKTLFAILLLFVVASPSFAQIFHPIALTYDFGGGRPGDASRVPLNRPALSVSFQAQYFRWEVPNTLLVAQDSKSFSSNKPTDLIALDGTLGRHWVAGGWYAQDSEKLHTASSTDTADTKLNTTWYEVHGAYLFYTKPSIELGGMLGFLKGHAEINSTTSSLGLDIPDQTLDEEWTEVALIGSVPVGTGTDSRPAPVAGFTVGKAFHELAARKDGTTYGLSFTYPLNHLWSIDLSTWELALDHSTTIDRAGGGIGYHF